MSLLVFAGEASGDRVAAAAVRGLGRERAAAFGVGGTACRRAGVEIVAESSTLAAMGAIDVLGRLPAIARALVALAARARGRPPRAALLANFTELSARLGPALRRRGVRVLWCVAPQVWAWRPGRVRALAPAMDRLAVILPFEEAIWRAAGVDATFVGHPAVELTRTTRAAARAALGIALGARAAVVLAGSRTGEILRLGGDLCRAVALLRARGLVDDVRVLAAPDLTPRARAALEVAARREDLTVGEADPDGGAAPLLSAFDVSLVASGTASLEAALAGASPVVAYRLDPLSHAIARRLVTTPFFALPNVVLGRAAVPELLQRDASPERIARAAEAALLTGAGPALAAELALRLDPGGARRQSFAERLAAQLADWLPEPPQSDGPTARANI